LAGVTKGFFGVISDWWAGAAGASFFSDEEGSGGNEDEEGVVVAGGFLTVEGASAALAGAGAGLFLEEGTNGLGRLFGAGFFGFFGGKGTVDL
jgi:hypothetical protein